MSTQGHNSDEISFTHKFIQGETLPMTTLEKRDKVEQEFEFKNS